MPSQFQWAWLIVFVGLCGSASVFAKSGNYFALDFGAHGSNLVERYQVAESNQGQVSSITGWLRFRPGFHLGKEFMLEISAALPLPWRTGQDGITKTFLLQSDVDFVLPLFQSFQIRTGFGLQSTFVTSNGGTVELSNGDGVSTFYLPDGFSISAAWTLQFGFSIFFTRSFTFNIDTYAVSLGSEVSRQFHAAVSLGYRL